MSVFKRKFPFQTNGNLLKEGLLNFAVVFLILFLLQPFGISIYEGNKFLVSLLFAAMTFVCTLVFKFFVVRPLQKHVRTWRIWHQAAAVLAMVLFIGLCNYFLHAALFHFPINLKSCLTVVYWTLIIGVLIAVLSTVIAYQRYMRRQLDALLDNTAQEQEGISVTIHDNRVRGNDLRIPLKNLLYVEAQKNNVAVFYVDAGKLVRKEIQTTLAGVLGELGGYRNIFQCHRSFAVNLNSITSAKGNSNGYILELGGGLATVPVSRSFVPKLKSFIA